MRLLSWLALAAAALALIAAPPQAQATVARTTGADADPHHVSYATWTVTGTTVRLRFMIPAAEARELVPKGTRLDAGAISKLVDTEVSVASNGGDCPQVSQGEWAGNIYTLALTPGLYRFEVIFECPQADGLKFHDGVMFDKGPGHVTYARIQVNGGQPVLQTFTRDSQTLALAAGNRATSAGPISFAKGGAGGLFIQLDRLCLIGGLLLLCRRWRDLGEIAAALGVGYLVSLGAALSGLVTPDLGLTGAALGLITAFLGLAALRLEAADQPISRGWRIGGGVAAGLIGAGIIALAALKGLPAGLAATGLLVFGFAQLALVGQQPRLRWLIFAPAAVFGLLDGLGLARDLALLQLPNSELAPAFIGYDLGMVAAATGLAAAAMAVLWLASRRLSWGRTVGMDMSAAALVGLGLFWYLSRLYG
jgi:hypothetical protein